MQDSVFECVLTEPQLAAMMDRLRHLTDPARDLVRVYRLCAACEKVILLHGRGEVTRDPEVYVV